MTFPVVLLGVALAVAAMVWSSSEHEAQRAADTAAVRAAATAFLGTDFPYSDVPGVTTPLSYPNVQAIAAAAGRTAPAGLTRCGTVGMPTVDPLALGLPGVNLDATLKGELSLPVDCSAVQPFVPAPALGAADQSRTVACETARAAMAAGSATYGTRFYGGSGDPQPSCADRIGVRLATGSPLIGFAQQASNAATGALQTRVVPQAASVSAALAAFGIRLGTSLPSLICPEISVGVDQPVREPVFDRTSVPSGRATARRVVKNAVMVPVFQGRSITAAATGQAYAASDGVSVTVGSTTGGTVTIPPVNLNAPLIDAQAQLLTLLDEVDAIADAAVKAAGITVDRLNGVYTGIDPDQPQPAPLPGSGPLQSLRLTKCLRDSLTQIYDPPTGDAPTADEVLADAAAAGEEVVVVQVGAVAASCSEPGAIPYAPALSAPTLTLTPDCIRAATTPYVNPLTGAYEVPFFDATPVLVQDLDDGNFAAVPVHASQASGAFRASLVRAATDELYDPVVAEPTPTPVCNLTVPAPTPFTACAILSASPPAAPTPSPTPTLPSPTLTLPTLPVPTSSSPTPTPTKTVTPTPSPSPSCVVVLLCKVTK